MTRNMRTVTLSAIAAALFTISFSLVFHHVTFSADSLHSDSLLCTNIDAFSEAEEAFASDDMRWMNNLHSCIITAQAIKARPLECGLRTCKIRFWTPSGSTAWGYVHRRDLFN